MKVVIAEDHLLFRELLYKICTHDLGYKVVGQTASGVEATALVQRHFPGILLLDWRLQDIDGDEVAAVVRTTRPKTRVLVVSAHLEPHTVDLIENARVHGYVTKSANSVGDLTNAMRALAEGKTWFAPAFEVARQSRQVNPIAPVKLLSPVEQRVLALIGEGFDDGEIALRLGCAPTTAQTHRSRILRKLRIDGTPRLMAFAIRNGFTRMTD